MKQPDQIAQALRDVLISPNVLDRNLEAANIVDVVEDVARAMGQVGIGTEGKPGALLIHAAKVEEAGQSIREGLNAVADALRELAEAVRK